jgi:hypothetical protein
MQGLMDVTNEMDQELESSLLVHACSGIEQHSVIRDGSSHADVITAISAVIKIACPETNQQTNIGGKHVRL